MNILLHAPYGARSAEAGVMVLLGKYLAGVGHSLQLLQCNGTFSLCNRDSESGWKRNLTSCLKCQQEQRGFSTWAGIPCVELSTFISTEEIAQSRNWISFLNAAQLASADLQGTVLAELCRGSFRERFGLEALDVQNKQHELLMRRLLLSTLRMNIASRKLLTALTPDLVLLAGGDDYITASLSAQAKQQHRPVGVFRWELNARAVRISRLGQERTYLCSLLLEDISSIRNDVRTWPPEVFAVLSEITDVLGIPTDVTEQLKQSVI
jgi:hypothetical protein